MRFNIKKVTFNKIKTPLFLPLSPFLIQKKNRCDLVIAVANSSLNLYCPACFYFEKKRKVLFFMIGYWYAPPPVSCPTTKQKNILIYLYSAQFLINNFELLLSSYDLFFVAFIHSISHLKNTKKIANLHVLIFFLNSF